MALLALWFLIAAAPLCGLKLVSSQKEGFLSIACGATENFTDSNGIEWVGDGAYVTTGTRAIISSEFYSQTVENLQQLRYFPESQKKSCIRVPATSNKKYLIRASFYYGNYDGKNSSPSFNLLLDAEIWAYVDLRQTDGLYEEMVYSPAKDYLSVCVAGLSDGVGAPFISNIELRPLQDGIYQTVSSNVLYLQPQYFVNFGDDNDNNSLIRYPDDQFDRFWKSDSALGLNTNDYSSINTTSDVVSDALNVPPSSVMATARSPSTLSSSLSFSFQLAPGRNMYYIALYFAELETLNDSESRSFNIFFDNLLYGSFDPTQLDPFTSTDFNNETGIEFSDTMTLTLTPTTTSTKPPILNAMELLTIYNVTMGTPLDYIYALNSISSSFNITKWMGDPCLPHDYSWDEIVCNYNKSQVEVEQIKLSNMQLAGSIPNGINELVSLVQLDLDNNSISGEIPDFGKLVNLQYLHLQNNKLSGQVPSSIFTLPALKELFLYNNDLHGIIPVHATRNINIRFDGNPLLCLSTNATCIKNGSTNKKVIIAVVVGVSGAFIFMLLVSFIYVMSRKRSVHLVGPPLHGANKSRPFTLQEVNVATNKFSNHIGKGGFGDVYYGRLSNGQEIAAKKRSIMSAQGQKEFYNEVQLLTQVHHKNVLPLLGYCEENDEQIVIYEYMSGGTLSHRLHDANAKDNPLDWKTRLNIILGAAQGFEYLHTKCNPRIIHRDVKSNNILLDAKGVAKVADFGLSRTTPQSEVTHVTTLAMGTPGYIDPEYFITNQLTDKSDVYSFGILLLETLSGHIPRQTGLGQWVQDSVAKGNIEEIIDPLIYNDYRNNRESMWKIVEVALSCIEQHSQYRPNMSTVVAKIKNAMHIENEHVYDDSSSGMTPLCMREVDNIVSP